MMTTETFLIRAAQGAAPAPVQTLLARETRASTTNTSSCCGLGRINALSYDALSLHARFLAAQRSSLAHSGHLFKYLET
jgi:hypothetical protein